MHTATALAIIDLGLFLVALRLLRHQSRVGPVGVVLAFAGLSTLLLGVSFWLSLHR